MKSSLRIFGLTAAVSLAAGTAWSIDFDLKIDAELNGFAQGILSAETAVAPNGSVTNTTGSGRVTIKPSLGNALTGLIAVEAWMGEGFDPLSELNTLEPVNADIDLDESADLLTEAYVSARLGSTGLYTVSAGKVDVSGLFDVSDVAGDQRTQFFHPSFRNSASNYYPGGDDAPRSLAAWLEFTIPNRAFEGTVGGALDEDPGDFYLFGEGRMIFGGRTTVGVYGWGASGSFPKHTGGEPVSLFLGFGGYVDYELPMTGDLNIFGRLGLVDQRVSIYKASLSFGAEIGGSAWGRPNDTVGGAFGWNPLSDDFARATGRNANEGALEGYYRFMLLIAERTTHRPSVEVTPNFQMIMNAGGRSGTQATLLWGLRVRSMVRF